MTTLGEICKQKYDAYVEKNTRNKEQEESRQKVKLQELESKLRDEITKHILNSKDLIIDAAKHGVTTDCYLQIPIKWFTEFCWLNNDYNIHGSTDGLKWTYNVDNHSYMYGGKLRYTFE